MGRMRHPITEAERAAFELLTRREREVALAARKRRLFDSWVNPSDRLPYVDPRLVGRGNQGWEELLDSTVTDGTAVTAAAETIVVPTFSIPAFYMAPGRVMRIYAAGTLSTVVTTPGTGVWRVRWAITTGVDGAILCASAAVNFNIVAQTLDGWNMCVLITCRTAGATGTFMTSGQLDSFNSKVDTSPGDIANQRPNVMGSAGTNSNANVTVDTTLVRLISVTYQPSVATGSLICQQRIIEILN